MLSVYYGIDWRENRRWLLEQVTAPAVRGGQMQVILVPDQFSHQMERELCLRGGDEICRYAEVLSFSRLADRVFAVGGGGADVAMDKGGRLLAMASAVEMVRPKLKKYASSSGKPEFLLQALQTLDECKTFCLGPEELRRAAEQSEGEFAVKLEELALLSESYEAACANGAIDASGRLMLLLDRLMDCSYDRDKSFYLEGFADFNGIELQVIQRLLADGCPVTAVLLCDDPYSGQHVYDGVRDTLRALERAAKKANEKLVLERISPAAVDPSLDFLRRNLFGGGAGAFGGDSRVRLHMARDAHEEVQTLAGEILKMVQSGCRFRDISVVCGDLNTYRPILQSAFARYQIPAYYAGNDAIVTKPVVQALLTALEAAATDMDPELVFAFLKSGLSPVSRDACDSLENYAFVWNISGSGWQEPWTQHPEGIGAEWTEATERQMQQLNRDREQAIGPLAELRRALREAKNTAGQVLALYDFMDALGFRAHMQQTAQKLAEEDNLQGAQEYAQLYQVVITALEQFYQVLGKTVHSAEEFYRLLRALLSQYEVGSIPAATDCVHVGSVMAMRQNPETNVCLIGACDGMLPTGPEELGLLSEQDRKALRLLGMTVAPGVPERLNRELNAIYNVMTGAEQTLYVSCVAGNPAYLFNRLERMFPKGVLPRQDLPEIVTRHPEAAREFLAQTRELEQPSLRGSLMQAMPDGGARLAEDFRRADTRPGSLSRQTVSALYGQTLNLSATRIDRYCKCAYGFFLEYGLGARERKQAAFDAPLYGTLVHYVLQHTARQIMEEGGFPAVSTDRAMEIAEQCIGQYTRQTLPDLEDKPERFIYLYNRNLDEIYQVVKNLCSELQLSDFEPTYFELDFRDNAPMPAVKILGQYMEGKLIGAVDRVDLFRDGEQTYARVVDYKTGEKHFDYTDILHGIGLQMLIYLFALEQGAEDAFGVHFEPGGVLYMPARVAMKQSAALMDEKAAEAVRLDEMRRDGLLLDDERILNAMEHTQPAGEGKSVKYQFLPNGKNHVASRAEFAALEKFLQLSLQQVVDGIAAGDVGPNPYSRGSKGSACSFCPYYTVCHVRSGGAAVRERKKSSREQFWEKVEERIHGC